MHRRFLAEAQRSIILINIILGVYNIVNPVALKQTLKRKRKRKDTYRTSQWPIEEKFIGFISLRNCQITWPQIRDTSVLPVVLLGDPSQHRVCLCEGKCKNKLKSKEIEKWTAKDRPALTAGKVRGQGALSISQVNKQKNNIRQKQISKSGQRFKTRHKCAKNWSTEKLKHLQSNREATDNWVLRKFRDNWQMKRKVRGSKMAEKRQSHSEAE